MQLETFVKATATPKSTFYVQNPTNCKAIRGVVMYSTKTNHPENNVHAWRVQLAMERPVMNGTRDVFVQYGVLNGNTSKDPLYMAKVGSVYELYFLPNGNICNTMMPKKVADTCSRFPELCKQVPKPDQCEGATIVDGVVKGERNVGNGCVATISFYDAAGKPVFGTTPVGRCGAFRPRQRYSVRRKGNTFCGVASSVLQHDMCSDPAPINAGICTHAGFARSSTTPTKEPTKRPTKEPTKGPTKGPAMVPTQWPNNSVVVSQGPGIIAGGDVRDVGNRQDNDTTNIYNYGSGGAGGAGNIKLNVTVDNQNKNENKAVAGGAGRPYWYGAGPHWYPGGMYGPNFILPPEKYLVGVPEQTMLLGVYPPQASPSPSPSAEPTAEPTLPPEEYPIYPETYPTFEDIPSPAPTTPPAPPADNRRKWIIALIVVLIVSLLIGGWIWWNKRKGRASSSSLMFL